MPTDPTPLPTEAEVARWIMDNAVELPLTVGEQRRLLALVERVMPIVGDTANSTMYDTYSDRTVTDAYDVWRRWKGEA